MLPDIAVWHPQIVHFVIALLFVGVIFRVVSLTGRLRFTDAGATTLILIGTIAAWLAVLSGDQAHGPVERIPGAREAVEEHEHWGVRTRNLFLVVAVLELAVLATRASGRRRAAKGLMIGSAVIGLGGLFLLYETAEHGGELVYEYGGGPGVRSGDPEHIERLLVAGLYHQAMLARREKRADEANRLIGELARMRPNDVGVTLLSAESTLRDRNDARGALQQLAGIAPDNERQRGQKDMLRADAYSELGQRDSAVAIMDALVRDNPDNSRIRAKADSVREQ